MLLYILISIILFLIFLSLLIRVILLDGEKIPNKILWESMPNEFNPSFANNVIAIRYSNWDRKNWDWLLKNRLKGKEYSDIILYKNNIRKQLNLNLQDPRIFYNKNNYYIIAVKSVNYNQEIIPQLITLNSNLEIEKTTEFNIKEKPVKQKNWNLFTDKNSNILIITDVYPEMIIRKVDLHNAKLLDGIKYNTSNFFPYDKYYIRCSSNFIPWKNNQLICILHLKKNITIRSIFFTIEDKYPYKPINYSKIYTFFNSYIEFVSGIGWKNNKIIVALGKDDYQGYIVEINPNDIEFIRS